MKDYRELLLKYMALILSEEGYDYLKFAGDGWNPLPFEFSKEDMYILRKLSSEASKLIQGGQ